jgi:drug/metabolite transporter (DMT)-like permease
LKDVPGQEAAILSYVDPLVAVLISVTLLHESMTVMQMIGGLLILGFTLWNEIEPKPKTGGAIEGNTFPRGGRWLNKFTLKNKIK